MAEQRYDMTPMLGKVESSILLQSTSFMGWAGAINTYGNVVSYRTEFESQIQLFVYIRI